MKTVKLYDKDSFLSEFNAEVLSCQKADNGYKSVLNQTAFFPLGGGQPADTGYIENIRVYDVLESDGEIYHYTKEPLKVGKKVFCKIDFLRRFNFMQNHSGEHIVSGIINRKYGLDNVGFHLSEQFVTVDFNGELTREQLNETEDEANRIVFENRNVKTFYPSIEQLKTINYRSKREIAGDLRIVEIDGADVCACCAPHVKSTGQIGLIKLLDHEKMRGGTRVILKCGRYALLDFREKHKNVYSISNMLSAKQEETFSAVENLNNKYILQKQKNSELKRRLISLMAAGEDKEKIFFYEPDFDMKEIQMLSDSLHKTHGGLKAVFSGCDDALSFAICDDDTVLQEFFTRFKSAFNVKGGGRNGMVQGSVNEDIKKIEEFFKG